MNFIECTGGNKFQREICYAVAGRMIKELLPRYRTLFITIDLKKFGKNEDAIGYAYMEDDNRTFTIELEKSMKVKDLIVAVCHEMVHIKQYAKNEMGDDGARWKKTKVKKGTKYYDLPWEKEAYRLEYKLADICWKEGII